MPDWRAYVQSKLPPLTVGPARENEIVAELALQLEQAYADAMAGGASAGQAERTAQLQIRDWDALGREISAAEERPAQWDTGHRAGWLAGGGHDIRYALRFLGRNPVFAAIAVLTLAFGIGGNTAIFTMVDAIALRSLPYPDPARLVTIETRKTQQPEMEAWTSALDFFDLRERAQSFSAVAAISPVWSLVMTGRGEAERLECLYVSAEFFPMLGVKSALGRTFLPQEDHRTEPSFVALVSDSFWRRRLGGSPGVVGTRLVLDGNGYTVVGVLPKGFRYAGEPLAGTATDVDVWLPLASNQIVGSARGLRFLKAIGRLRGGVTVEQARGEVRRIEASLAEQYPDTNRGFAGGLQPLSAQVTGRFRSMMLLLLGTVGFVLLMACANVSNLLLARAAVRQREIAVRVALGASRFRLMRQLMTEGAVLAVMGGVLGLGLAKVALQFLVRLAPASLLGGRELGLDARAFFVTLGAAAACALLAGAPPAWQTVRGEIGNALREAGRGLTARHHLLRSALVVGEVAMALVLLVGAGLLIHSFRKLLDVNPGFQAAHLVTISTQMPASAVTPEQRTAVYRSMRDRLVEVAGVVNVAAVSRLPLMGANLGTWLFVEGKSRPGEPAPDVEYRAATPEYFATMGIPLRAGRLFDAHDEGNAGGVLLINETAARRFWPGESAVGKRVKLGMAPDRQPWITIIGVVGDVRHSALDARPLAEVYRLYAYNPMYSPILVVRTQGDPAPLVSELAARVRSVSSESPAYNVYVMEALVERSAAQRKFVMWLLAGFAAAALLLAGVGIYGTVSQAVAHRTQEIGLRVALGASPREALALVFGQGMCLMLVGVLAGAVAAAGLAQLMRSLLFEVQPLDPMAFCGAAVVLGGFAALACYIPAHRATRVDPLIALRNDG